LDDVTTTVISLTLVFVLGTETVPTIGVTPGANGMMTDGLVSMKFTPEEPGLRSEGEVEGDAPINVTLLIYCGSFMPKKVIYWKMIPIDPST
jgi:hypothetical protein